MLELQNYNSLVPAFHPLQPYRNLYSPPALWNSGFRDLGDNFRALDRQLDRLMRQELSPWGFGQGSLPLDWNVRLPSTPSMYETHLDGKYQMNVSMGAGFKPENIKVTLQDRDIKVEAKYDRTSDDGRTRVYQHSTRMFSLPKNIDPAEVKSKLTPEGFLQIEAPLPSEPEGSKPKEIPIEMKSG